MFWIVRTTNDPMSLAASLAREVRRTDPDVIASQIRPMDRYPTEAMAPRRFSLSLMAAFALAALALAVTGIYAVVSYSISQRAREFGIRIALGASRASLVRLVMGQRFRSVLAGLVLGMTMAFGVMRPLSTMLFGVSATDAATFVQVAVILTAASAVACAVPTARAGRSGTSVLKAE
jgi:putative ABC transport system permease protein